MKMLKYIGAIIVITIVWITAIIIVASNGSNPSIGLLLGLTLPFMAIIIFLAIKTGLTLKRYKKDNEQQYADGTITYEQYKKKKNIYTAIIISLVVILIVGRIVKLFR